MFIVAHDIRSLHNVGAIFRSCDAFGVEKLYLSGITGTPPRKEIAKVALGSQNRVPWEQVKDLREHIKLLKSQGVTVVALDNAPGARSINDTSLNEPIALILGNEVEGVDEELKAMVDFVVEIPMPGQKQSLNVSVAAGVALFALTQKKR